MTVAADTAPVTQPWLAIVLAVLTLLGVIATAAGPAVVERIKNAGKPKDPKPEQPPSAAASAPEQAPQPSTPSIVARTDQALDLVEKALLDAQEERDKAQAKNEKLQKRIGYLEAELYRRDPTWNGGADGRAR